MKLSYSTIFYAIGEFQLFPFGHVGIIIKSVFFLVFQAYMVYFICYIYIVVNYLLMFAVKRTGHLILRNLVSCLWCIDL